MEDNHIIELYFQRSEDALKETQMKYGNYLYSIAHNILCNHEDTEECVNDVYQKAWTDNQVECIFDAKELTAAVNAFLGRMSKRNRILFVRRYWL